MARGYQVLCVPGSVATIAGPTIGGGMHYTLSNVHATEPVLLGGDENELRVGGGASLSAGTASTFAYVLKAGTSVSFNLDGNEQIFGRAQTSTVSVTVAVLTVRADRT